ncbi:hypothetical protein DTO166G4_1425 [Paecilomyces variotii]|nr:hypothetical protein DTO166G4_1425 [Paecilomyces variotii]KAJ9226214.1 hypothetical protein DTO169C6_1427 [Paecilomyces variotii]KAJ9242695.1 hypothetical protein DTO166G5_450 [Paecilomyces variotii]KAJ9266506.1 hypothetical protein DTO195F2_1029 [Paecilomyces variotii]KAJ9289233.1 hypothetical protein DTO021C3_3059 [Paecilomyces variotii]
MPPREDLHHPSSDPRYSGSSSLNLSLSLSALSRAGVSRTNSHTGIQYFIFDTMTINPTFLAQKTRSSVNWADAKRRVLRSYRHWLRASPEIQTMYSLNMPVSAIRTKIRQEFEQHRYVNQLSVVDVLIQKSNAEFQETLNYWKQLSHVMKYFRPEEDPTARLPPNFISGFLEGRN